MTAGRDAPSGPALAAHAPVLLDEVLDALAVRADGTYVDATFGRGGHSAAILAALGAGGRLVALDRDPEAGRVAGSWADPRFLFLPGSFGEIGERLADAGVEAVDGALFDLGVSSPQLDDAARGFSFRFDGPLDMRMDPSQGQSAAEWIAGASEQELKRVIAEYGEERAAGQIARAIAAERAREPIVTTRRLADVVGAVVRRARRGRSAEIDPATRTFQAVRIHVNDELGQIARALASVLPFLRTGARLVVISFHSLEDRIVKQFIRFHSGRVELDPRLARLPIVPDAPPVLLAEVGGLVRPGDDESRRNPRARSARMRVAVRTAQPLPAGWAPGQTAGWQGR